MSKQALVPQHPSPRLKIIVRRLPPHLPENVFWQSVEPWVNSDSVSWKKFHPGKLRPRYGHASIHLLLLIYDHSDRLNKEDIPTRAYIQFKSLEQIAAFSKEYDGHVFRDKQGAFRRNILVITLNLTCPGRESYAVVEFAPFQKVSPPKERIKVDQRNATIDKGQTVPQSLLLLFIMS